MVTFADLRLGLLKLRLSHTPVVAHASLSAFGEVLGGAGTLLRAALDSVWALIMPAFTYRTMITPEVGPPNNGIIYGADTDLNRSAQPFLPDMPADRSIGMVAEALRTHPRARRTSHPILSFAGVNADRILAAQSLENPLGVFGALADADGWILLLGVDHTVNTSIHYGEQLAGRRSFIRWALMSDRVVECPCFPGDSSGFGGLAGDLAPDTLQVRVGGALIQAMPVRAVIRAVSERLQADPLSLLCSRANCPTCNAVRESAGAPAQDAQFANS